MPGILQITAGKGVIAPAEIRQEHLQSHIDFHAILHPMDMLAGVGENQKVRTVANLDIEPFAQKMVKKIIGLGKPRPKIAEIKFHSQHRFHAGKFRRRRKPSLAGSFEAGPMGRGRQKTESGVVAPDSEERQM
jgi:hypothetical protein